MGMKIKKEGWMIEFGKKVGDKKRKQGVENFSWGLGDEVCLGKSVGLGFYAS